MIEHTVKTQWQWSICEPDKQWALFFLKWQPFVFRDIGIMIHSIVQLFLRKTIISLFIWLTSSVHGSTNHLWSIKNGECIIKTTNILPKPDTQKLRCNINNYKGYVELFYVQYISYLYISLYLWRWPLYAQFRKTLISSLFWTFLLFVR